MTESAARPVNEKQLMERFHRWLWGLHGLASVLLGLAFFPMVFLFYTVWKSMAWAAPWLKILALSFSIGLGYFVFGLTLILLCVLAKNIFGFRITPGFYTMYSIESLRWMGYNSLILIANNAFLDVLRISPFQTLFCRLMGAKIGKGVNVNTAGLADLCMLEIGDDALIGGGVALICHAFDRGFLRLLPTKIGKKVSIGLGSVIMPDCEIGEGASVAPCSFVPKGSRIPAKAVWGGNPAEDLRAKRRAEMSQNRADQPPA